MYNRNYQRFAGASSDALDKNNRWTPEDPSSHNIQDGSKFSSFKPKRPRAMLMTRITPGQRRLDRAMAEYLHAHFLAQIRMEAAREHSTEKHVAHKPSMRKIHPCLPPAYTDQIFRRVPPTEKSVLPKWFIAPTEKKAATEISGPTKENVPCIPTRSNVTKVNNPESLEYLGFGDILRPGIWDVDARQFGQFDIADGLDIAEKIKLQAQLEDSYDSSSFYTSDEWSSYESSYYESPSESETPCLPPAYTDQIFRRVPPTEESVPPKWFSAPTEKNAATEISGPTKENVPCIPTRSNVTKVNNPECLEYLGFGDILRPGIWDVDARQFGQFDKADGLNIAEQIKLQAQLEDSYDNSSFYTSDEWSSYESSYYESPSESETPCLPPAYTDQIFRRVPPTEESVPPKWFSAPTEKNAATEISGPTKENVPCIPTRSNVTKVNNPDCLEYLGFGDILRPGIWDVDARQFGQFDKADGLNIAEQIKLQAQLEDSYDSSSFDTSDEWSSYESSYYESPSESETPIEPPRRGNRVMRFLRRLKKVFF